MRVFWLNTLDELAPYADEWERLAGGVPFRSWTWLSNWWRHYGPNDADNQHTQLATLCVFDDANALVGVAPWYLDCSAMRGRVLRPLGCGEVCSEYLTVLCQPSREAAVADAIADFLVQNTLDKSPDTLHWDSLDLEAVDAEDRSVAELVRCLSGADCSVHRENGPSCWRLELPTDWESYLASLSKRQRRTVRRLERDLLTSGRATLHCVTRLDELPRAMELLVDLHQRRRQSLGEPGCFAS
ncbi:MAG: GNAT family N-acetyltransferase, partial [Planctomycetaceae bacterium]|nr:GNAT family N-acetyltransferase [Planctomycetaceae bacterium]